MKLSEVKNIVLIGPMATGKSAIGRTLAAELGVDFIDTDKAIEQHCNADIPLIFEKEGEAGFRRREAEMIASLANTENCIIATGGGTILLEENRQRLLSMGPIIYLMSTVEQIMCRVRKNNQRPLLKQPNPQQVVTELLEHRHPIYEQMADICIRPEDRKDGFKQVTEQILQALCACRFEKRIELGADEYGKNDAKINLTKNSVTGNSATESGVIEKKGAMT